MCIRDRGYDFGIALNTSFTGEDSLDIAIDAGNAFAFGEFDADGTAGDMLVVDGVSYTFPVGGATVFVGDNTDGSLLFTTAVVNSKLPSVLSPTKTVAPPTGNV